MKYKSFCMAGLLTISLSTYAQFDSLKFWKAFSKLKESEVNRTAEIARKTKLEGDRWRYLMVANEISARSREFNNKELAALLAVQAYNFNSRYNGYEYNNNVYAGLIAALKRYDSLFMKLSGQLQLTLVLHSNAKIDSVKRGNDLIIGSGKGEILIVTNGIVRKKLSFHRAKVDLIKFSPTGKSMVTVDKDNILCIWNFTDLTKHPLVIKENVSIEDVAFSSDETQIVVRVKAKEFPIHVWPLNLMTMANKLCSCLEKNMTLEEWEQYVGKDDIVDGIPYQSTCPNFPPRK